MGSTASHLGHRGTVLGKGTGKETRATRDPRVLDFPFNTTADRVAVTTHISLNGFQLPSNDLCQGSSSFLSRNLQSTSQTSEVHAYAIGSLSGLPYLPLENCGRWSYEAEGRGYEEEDTLVRSVAERDSRTILGG